ncbi:MAG: helix-turn-helix transcriptional regulator [Planctomycetota bacterium]|jgi:AraC-like DNA-binding protein
MIHFQTRHVERFDQVRPYHCISLIISGVNRYEENGVDAAALVPGIMVGVKGAPVTLDFGRERENWTAIVEEIDLHLGEDPRTVVVGSEAGRVTLPMGVRLEPAEVHYWRGECQRAQEALLTPTADNRLLGHLIIQGMWRRLLEAKGRPCEAGPAVLLKNRLDEDEGFTRSLAEHGEGLGYSPDHLRILFQEAYQLSPQAYRNERRFSLAMDLVMHSTCSVKEMAHRLGFKHDTALNAFFKKRVGIPPSQAIRRYRK